MNEINRIGHFAHAAVMCVLWTLRKYTYDNITCLSIYNNANYELFLKL